MFCSNCGQRLDSGAKYCSKCGNSVEGLIENIPYKTVSKTFRGLLMGIGQSEIQEVNRFLREGNFQKVSWNFSVSKGIVNK